jgi:hypothetical protein
MMTIETTEPKKRKRYAISAEKMLGKKPCGKLGLLGVYHDITRPHTPYVARCTYRGIPYRIGYFDSAIEASEARQKFVADLMATEAKRNRIVIPTLKPVKPVVETKYDPTKSRFYHSTFELDAA